MKSFIYESNTFRSERELAEYYNIPHTTLHYRLQSGMPLEDALNPQRKKKKGKR